MRRGFMMLVAHVCYGFLSEDDVRVARNIQAEDEDYPEFVDIVAGWQGEAGLSAVQDEAKLSLGRELLGLED